MVARRTSRRKCCPWRTCIASTTFLLLLLGSLSYINQRSSVATPELVVTSGPELLQSSHADFVSNLSQSGSATSRTQGTPSLQPLFSPSSTAAPLPDATALTAKVRELRQNVIRLRQSLGKGHFMETDPTALNATAELQVVTRKLLAIRYGPEPYRVALDLAFPRSMPGKRDARIVIQLAPASLLPHSVHTFLEIAIETWKGGAFHRAASHVLQAKVFGKSPGMAFQEYSKAYPHVMGTLGFAGRPGGPGFYISTIDNTRNHGPGTQQKDNPHEADSCFGRVVEGWKGVVARMKLQPGASPSGGFVNDPAQHIVIKSARLLH